MKRSMDVVVVGGGIFGAAGALTLRERGFSVTVVDPGPLPYPRASSTDISKVIRMEYGADEFYLRAMEQALEGWRAWNSGWDRPFFHETGVLVLTNTAMEAGTFEGDSFDMLYEHGHQVDRLDAGLITQQFPAWAVGENADGYYNQQGGWAESGRVVEWLIIEAKRAGVEVLEGERMLGLTRIGDRVTGITTERGNLAAGNVVLAAGAWTPALFPDLKGHIWPVAQPVYHFKAPDLEHYQPPLFSVWICDVASTGWYGFPALDDGTLKIANHGPGLLQPPSPGVDAARGREAQFRRFLDNSLHGLRGAQVLRTRTCYYSDSWDGDFYITAVPRRENLFIASGGSGHAFKFAPLLGGWIADTVERRAGASPVRFVWREPGERRTEEARHLDG